MSDDAAERAQVMQRIARMANTVPVKQYQAWSASRAAEFKAACTKARKVLAKSNVSTSELRSVESQMQAFWA